MCMKKPNYSIQTQSRNDILLMYMVDLQLFSNAERYRYQEKALAKYTY